jgi:hypothetical protein
MIDLKILNEKGRDFKIRHTCHFSFMECVSGRCIVNCLFSPLCFILCCSYLPPFSISLCDNFQFSSTSKLYCSIRCTQWQIWKQHKKETQWDTYNCFKLWAHNQNFFLQQLNITDIWACKWNNVTKLLIVMWLLYRYIDSKPKHSYIYACKSFYVYVWRLRMSGRCQSHPFSSSIQTSCYFCSPHTKLYD